jgi:hypothetical protein
MSDTQFLVSHVSVIADKPFELVAQALEQQLERLRQYRMQGAALGERKKVSDIQVVGAIISPTTVSGINDAISDRLIRCRQAP